MDRTLYKRHMQKALAEYPNLDIYPASVRDLLWEPGQEGQTVGGVKLGQSLQFSGRLRCRQLTGPLRNGRGDKMQIRRPQYWHLPFW